MSKSSLTHHYDNPRDAVMAPHKFMALTHYYVDRWLPELGERGHIIVTVLRRMGYLDRARDIERGGIEIEQEELAALCGLKLRTLQREFAEDEKGSPINSALHQFVQREKQYYRNAAGRVVREKTVYVVQMRDPLHPTDQKVFQEECDQREKGCSRQSGGNSDPRSRQIGGTTRQGGGNTNKEILDSKLLLRTPDTAALPGVSASLFEEGESDQEEAEWDALSLLDQAKIAEVAWAKLPKAERAPWLQQAEQELIAIHVGTGITPKTKLIEARGANLYEMSLRGKEPKSQED